MVRFRSKIDPPLLIVPVVLIGFAAAAVAGAVWRGAPVAAALVLLPGVGLIGWIFSATWYDVTESELVVRCGPFVNRVPLSAIRRIDRTNTVLSAAALSLDRLEVHHDGGVVVISPRDQEGFVSAIRSRVPAVTWDAAATTAAGARTAVWGLLIMPLALMLVLAYVFYKQR